jgi:histidine triad (HIT) family protein
MASVFSKIISGKIPCYKIAENENFIAFLDVSPIVKGHVLIVPKLEVDKLFDVDVTILAQWLPFAQPIANAIEKAFDCKRCGISVIGLEVPHAHMHLVPMQTADDLNFTRPKLKFTSDEMRAVQQAITHFLQPLH